MEKIIELKHINKSYGDRVVLEDFNLTIHAGDFLSIVGSSGSGKTTIMKMINGLIIPDSGEVCIKGDNIAEKDVIALRRKIGYVIQGNGLFPHMTVAENIGFVPMLEKQSLEEREAIVDKMLNLVGLSAEDCYKYPEELSGGQQQRVGIARAYANQPEILLMDEPFGAVDAITRYQLQKDLKRIHQKTKCTIVFITHDIHEAFKLSTHILVLDAGKVQQLGRKEEVWSQPSNDFVKRLIDMTQ